MSCLPPSGRINCTLCHAAPVEFNRTRMVSDGWRITANPLAWGNSRPEVLILGFSKGPNAVDALGKKPHDQIPYAGQRANVGKILAHCKLIRGNSPSDIRGAVDRAIEDQAGRFGWGSLVRCTVERYDGTVWKGSGGGMLDKFMATPFGQRVTKNCATQYLGDLPLETKLVVLFGLGTKLGYVTAARKVLAQARPSASWRAFNDVAYTDGRVMFVHVEHFAAQGSLIPDWLGIPDKLGRVSARARWGQQAQAAIGAALPT